MQRLTLLEPATYWVLEQLGEPDPVEEVNAFVHLLFGREVTEDELAAMALWQSEELDHPPRSVAISVVLHEKSRSLRRGPAYSAT